ncbi:MAG: hypothetical protein AB1679_27765 [Actinomycetota bacterium]|jgi:hypothetical protein
MTDEPEVPFAGLDAERPLPPELRARLEAALLAAVAGGLPVPADARELHQPPGTHTESLDAPRPLPEPLRARLEAALLAETAGAALSSTATGRAQGPYRASGATGRAQASPGEAGTVVSLAGRRRKVVAWWSAVAAVVVLLLAVAGLAGIDGGGSGKVEVAEAPATTTTKTPASLPSEAGVSGEAPSPAPPATAAPTGTASTATTRGSKPVKAPPSTTGPTAPTAGPTENTAPPPTPAPMSPTGGGGGGEAAPVPTKRGPAPPFYDSTGPSGDAANPPAMTSQPGPSSPAGGADQQGATPNQPGKSSSPTAAPAGPALRVGIIPGEAAQENGFRAYINRLNQNGGVAGHLIELVTVGPGSPAVNTIATVNLSALPVAGPGGAPDWAAGPLLETLTATGNLLPGHGAVFSFASPPERQGHLAADALFPSEAPPGTKAVIYVPVAAGPLRDVVPDAIKAVLTKRGVKAEVVPYDPQANKPLTPNGAVAAFVSLDPAAARAWVSDAKTVTFPAGVAGIYSLADEALLADLPEGARVVSPYVVPAGAEGQAIRSEAGGTSASVLHGWATAKSLAAAIWRTGADTPAEVQAALEGLAGWSSGLTPPYEVRPGTRARTPEGVLFRVQSGAFIAESGFRRDPH